MAELNVTEQLKGMTLNPEDANALRDIKRSDLIISFYGNPGTGKSTILNALLNRVVFTSGISSNGAGVTSHTTYVLDRNITYLDTPGLNDPTKKELVIKEIQNSLIEKQNYKIIFICNLNAGRVSPSDMSTINTVLSAIPETRHIDYGIIYNKLTHRVLAGYQSNDSLEQIHKKLLKRQPQHVLLLEKLDELDDNDNHLCENPVFLEKVKDFIHKLGNLELHKVEKIKSDDYDQMVSDLEIKYAELLREKQLEIEKIRQETEAKLQNTVVNIQEEFRYDKRQYERQGGNRVEKSFYRWKPVTLKYTILKTIEETTTFKRIITTKASGESVVGQWEKIAVSEIEISSREHEDKREGW